MKTPAADPADRLLTRLEGARRDFSPDGAAQAEASLAALGRHRFSDPASLIRFHECLLFLRTYPHNAQVRRQAESLLSSFSRRVAQLRSAGANCSAFDPPEVSGIAGTAVEEVFGYDVVRRLLERHPGKVRAAWDRYEPGSRTAGIVPRFVPLLDEESLVEANVPYLRWLRAASGGADPGLGWLLGRLGRLSLPETETAELYDSLGIPVRWELANTRASRTRDRYPARGIFYHREPLIRRSHVSLAKELESPPLPVTRLARTEGERILDQGREGMAVRHRELYAFTHGDPAHVLMAEVGRGVEIFLCGLLPQRRLPLRAYHGFLVYKNGVQVGYGDLLTLFERAELAFNHYYAFREGESAWIYARLLLLLRHLFGVTCFTVDPYQIGHENDEAIESGAFWFYRKLGFRPLHPELASLVEAEERKIAVHPGYRTPARILRRIARGHIAYEVPGTTPGAWDQFQARSIGLAVQRRMAGDFHGDAEEIRNASLAAVGWALGLTRRGWSQSDRHAVGSLALVLALIPDLGRWEEDEKALLLRIIRAKLGPEELRYVRQLQRHPRLRTAILRLGSTRTQAPSAPGGGPVAPGTPSRVS
ncbi:MAG TPA: hypothetical protein VLT62_10285 [Candidatus Methylomirabilis sp.]|nr:hypothetical protein [Candidatus Methylomirabilis sp.]